MRLNVGVIYGGKSVEHEISIISAISMMSYFDDNKYKVIPIYIDKNNNWYTGEHLKSIMHYRDISLVKRYAKKVQLLKRNNTFVLESQGLFKKDICSIDVVIPIGHGSFMEDGALQGYLTMLGVPFAGSNVLASSLGQDKVIQKDLLKQNGIPVCNYIWFYDYEFEKNKKEVLNRIKNLSYPMYVKPASLGSSIGITMAKNEKELINGIKEAIKFDRKILIEEGVENVKEVNISVMGNYEKQTVSDIEEINALDDFYTFKEKYVDGYNKTKASKKVDKIVSKEMIEDLKNYAIKTFKTINASGIARIDFLINYEKRKIFVNEINTIPGDLAAYLWMNKKIKPDELIENLIKFAFDEHKKKKATLYAFSGNLLENYDNLSGEKLKNKKSKEKNNN